MVQPAETRAVSSRVAWRAKCLIASGCDRESARTLAAEPELDLHALCELIERDCPPALAARIVAPLD
jgi:hypothetical protein